MPTYLTMTNTWENPSAKYSAIAAATTATPHRPPVVPVEEDPPFSKLAKAMLTFKIAMATVASGTSKRLALTASMIFMMAREIRGAGCLPMTIRVRIP